MTESIISVGVIDNSDQQTSVGNILCCVLVRVYVRGGIGMSAVHRCGSPQLSAASHLRHLGRRLSEHAA